MSPSGSILGPTLSMRYIQMAGILEEMPQASTNAVAAAYADDTLSLGQCRPDGLTDMLQQAGHNLELTRLSFCRTETKYKRNKDSRTIVRNDTSVVPSVRPATDGYWWSISGAGNCVHEPGRSSGQPHDLQCACWPHSPANVRNTLLSITHPTLPHWGGPQAAGADTGSHALSWTTALRSGAGKTKPWSTHCKGQWILSPA